MQMITKTKQSNVKRKFLCASFLFIIYLSVFSYAEASSRIVVLGSSTARGYGLSDYKTAWVARYRTHLQGIDANNQVINLSYSGYTTYHAMPDDFKPSGGRPSPDKSRNITMALSYSPDAIIINFPTNDISQGFDINETLENYATMVRLASEQGVPVWIATPQPASYTDAGLKQKLFRLRDLIVDIYQDHSIDFWSEIATEDGGIKSTYRQSSTDKVHLNASAHKILFERALNKNIHISCNVPGRSLYLIGGATGAVWDGEKTIPFVQDPDNPDVHTLQCELRHSTASYGTNFRILNQPNLTGNGLFPVKNGEILSEGTTTVVKKKSTTSSSNYKWAVPSGKQGFYKLTVNLSKNTLESEYLGEFLGKPEELYLTGGVIDAGWDGAEAIPFIKDADNPDIFTLQSALIHSGVNNGTQLRILIQRNSVGYGLFPKTNGEMLTEQLSYFDIKKSKLDNSNYRWTLPAAKQGYYNLTVNLSEGTLKAEYLGQFLHIPEELYLIGGATDAGWQADSAIPFVRDADNPNLFVLNTLLKVNSGTDNNKFKILEQPDLNGYSLHPATENLSLGSTCTVNQKKDPVNTDYKWVVPTAKQGYYRLTVDVSNHTLTAEYLGRVQVLPAKLYLIGGATEIVSWDGTKGIPFEQDPENPNMFYLETLLKITTVANGDQFRIIEQDKSNGYGMFPSKNKTKVPSVSTYVEKTSSTSNSNYRWVVPTDKQGHYRLIVDIQNKTLTAEYLGQILLRSTNTDDYRYIEDAISENGDYGLGYISIIPDANNIRILPYEVNSPVSVKVFAVDGRIVADRKSNGEEVTISGLSQGVYIVNVMFNGKQSSRKILIK